MLVPERRVAAHAVNEHERRTCPGAFVVGRALREMDCRHPRISQFERPSSALAPAGERFVGDDLDFHPNIDEKIADYRRARRWILRKILSIDGVEPGKIRPVAKPDHR